MWPIKGIDSLCEITSSKRVYAKDLCTSGVPFFRSKEIIEKLNGQEAPTNPLFISEEHFQEIFRTAGAPSKGDLLLTSRGTLGVPYIVKATDRFHFADGNLTWFRRFNDLNSQFLKYFLLSPSGKAELSKCVIGSAQSAYTISALKKIAIPLPPLSTQDHIASILSAYDDLIENNTRRIKILEDMAQMLYREWFVNFRFPGHEKGQMVESELGSIPKGWAVQPLGSLTAVVTKGTTPTTLGRQFQDAGVNFVKVESITESGAIIINKLAKIDSDTHELLKRSQLRHNDILFSIAGAIGRVALVPIRVLPANTNQALAIIRCSDPNFIIYLLSTVRSAHFQNFSLGRVVQTAQANVSLSILKSAPILVPPPPLLTSFRETSEPILALVGALSSKLENLRTTRDLLLPKLISGETPVDAAAELVEQTA